jgi:hypothetical protein
MTSPAHWSRMGEGTPATGPYKVEAGSRIMKAGLLEKGDIELAKTRFAPGWGRVHLN